MKLSRSVAAMASVAMLATAAQSLAAQDELVPTLGVRSAITYARMGSFSARPGYSMGPTFAMPLNNWFAVQAELVYTSFGGRFTGASAFNGFSSGQTLPLSSSQFGSFQFIQLPVLARFDLGRILGGPVRPTFYLGPQASYLLSCQSGHDLAGNALPCGSVAPSAAGLNTSFVGLNSFDVGAMAGVGVVADLFNVAELATEVRYQRGFMSVDPLNSQLRNNSWSVAFRIAPTGLFRGSEQRYSDAPPDIYGSDPMAPLDRGGRRSSLKGAVKGIRM